MAKKETVLEGQTWLDMAIQTGGSLESAILLAVANNVSITDLPTVGQQIEVSPPGNKQVVDYYMKKGLTPATGLNADENGEGIEFWAIERDFVIS
jgi:hypothetical protein